MRSSRESPTARGWEDGEGLLVEEIGRLGIVTNPVVLPPLRHGGVQLPLLAGRVLADLEQQRKRRIEMQYPRGDEMPRDPRRQPLAAGGHAENVVLAVRRKDDQRARSILGAQCLYAATIDPIDPGRSAIQGQE